MQKDIIEYLSKIQNPYILKIGDMFVELKYSENAKKFDECMLNILKRKAKGKTN